MAVVLAAEGLPDHIRDESTDGQGLDPPGAPVRRDDTEMAALQFLRAAPEKHRVEHFAKPVDVKSSRERSSRLNMVLHR